MLPTSIGWLKTLPRYVRPMALVIQYPRVANCIALTGTDQPRRACFIELLVDRRGSRKGFPGADVHGDLYADVA